MLVVDGMDSGVIYPTEGLGEASRERADERTDAPLLGTLDTVCETGSGVLCSMEGLDAS